MLPREYKMNEAACMVDIETGSTSPESAILSIGACIFDPKVVNTADELRANSFSAVISFESNEAANREFSGGTMKWWLQQSQEAIAGLFEGNITQLNSALVEFKTWVNSHVPQPVYVWAKSPSFDVVILESAFKQAKQIWPFQFWNTRDVRTIETLAFPNGPDELPLREGVHHRAVDDAIYQAICVQTGYQRLGLSATADIGC